MAKAILLPNVQVARGLAAAMVVAQHAFDQTHNHPIAGIAETSFFNKTSLGNGVDIFFVISGFIMVYITGSDKSDEVRPGTFFLRRLQRVAPLYWLFTLLMIAAALANPGSVNKGLGSAWHVVSSFLFIPSERPDGMLHPVLGLGWTLNYEFFFYSVFALALFAGRHRAPFIVSGLFVLLAIFGSYAPHGALSFWSKSIILEFVMGMALAGLFLTGRRMNMPAAIAVAAIGIAATLFFPLLIPEAPRFVVSGLPSLAIVAVAVLSAQRASARLPAMIGDASYAIYLSHPFALNITTAIWRKAHLPAVTALYLAALFCASLILGYIVHRLVEMPIARYVKRLRPYIERSGNPNPALAG